MRYPNKLFPLIFAIFFLVGSQAVQAQRTELKQGASFCNDVKGAECLPEGGRFTGQMNGVKFSAHSDGSAWVQGEPGLEQDSMDYLKGWSVSCYKDVISADKFCHLSRGDISVNVRPNGRPLVSLAGRKDQFPGTAISLRVGRRVFHSTADHYFSEGKAITSLMKDGVEVATKYIAWPDRSVETSVTPELYGFQTALQIATWTVKNLR